MSEKPEALRLADDLDVASLGIRHCLEALSAAELRRLHADNERLRDELRQSGIDHTRAEVERLKAERDRRTDLLLAIREDEHAGAWHRYINEALQEPPR